MRKSLLSAAFCLVVMLGFSLTAVATPTLIGCGPDGVCTLDELLAGGSIQIDDKLFSNFNHFSATGTGGATAITPAEITVTPIGEGTLEEGLLFQAGFLTINGAAQDTTFHFDVSNVHGAATIVDDLLAVTGAVTGTGTFFITEDVANAGGSSIASGQLLVIDTSLTSFLLDVGSFAPQSLLHVSKDIYLTGGPAGVAAISDFTQEFSQIPEPASLLLLGSGMAALGILARRKRSAK